MSIEESKHFRSYYESECQKVADLSIKRLRKLAVEVMESQFILFQELRWKEMLE